MGIVALPVFMKILNESSKVGPNNLKQQSKFDVDEIFSILILINVTMMTFSSIMVMATKRELMFPQRTAPKYVFDVF